MTAMLSFSAALALFAVSAAAVWIAGVYLSHTTDVLSRRLGLGEAHGGLMLLARVTNLPEISITASAALHHDLGIVIGTQMPGSILVWRVTPPVTLIGVLWLAGLWLVNKARRGLPWHDAGLAP